MPPEKWWIVYALAAAAGMYTLYYFAFLLIPLNLWALAVLIRKYWIARAGRPRSLQPLQNRPAPVPETAESWALQRLPAARRNFLGWLLANLAAAILYAPWIPVAWRQAITPPVPPWRTAAGFVSALAETWTALSLGQSAPAWLWPVLLLTFALYILGLIHLWRHGRGRGWSASLLVLATCGPFALILLISRVTPLYHVRYMFTYSPAFYIVLAAGFVAFARRWRAVAWVAAAVWLIACAVTLRAFWHDPAYRADDHRAAVRALQAQWRPGDVALVNAGWAYTALATYWDGPIASQTRLTGPLPAPRDDAALVMVTTGHVDGDAGLGWGDPASDFFALPVDVAGTQITGLFDQFARVWQYRIYDTVNDPDGVIRGLLDAAGQMTDDAGYPGEAYMRVQRFVPQQGVDVAAGLPTAAYENGASVQWEPVAASVKSGDTIYPALTWRLTAPLAADFATSLRLVDADDVTWAQPPDERPLGPLFPPTAWMPGVAYPQPLSLTIPPGTPPGVYAVALVVYDPNTGQPLAFDAAGAETIDGALQLGAVQVEQAAELPLQRALTRFGPLLLLEAGSPATTVSPDGQVPVELLWQAENALAEPLVVVVQLLGKDDKVLAGLEEQPLQGRYPTQQWASGELVRDRHTLTIPAGAPPGDYRLVVGVYRASDGQRFTAQHGPLSRDTVWTIRDVEVR